MPSAELSLVGPTSVEGSRCTSRTLLRRDSLRTVLLAGSIGHARTGGPPTGTSLGSSASGLSLSTATRTSPSLGRSLAGSAHAGMVSAARSSPRTDIAVRNVRLVARSASQPPQQRPAPAPVSSIISLLRRNWMLLGRAVWTAPRSTPIVHAGRPLENSPAAHPPRRRATADA